MPADSRDMVFVSATCAGEVCRCGAPAVRKVGEEIPHDDPNPGRHNLTAYVCARCFANLLGPVAARSVGLSASPARGEGDAPVAWQGPGEKPHDYFPDIMAMGDCMVCGHTYDAHPPENGGPRTHPTPATPAGEDLREKVSLALDNWIVCGLREADRKLASIDPVGCSGMTQEDVDAGRVAAYQKGYQNGVKATLTDAAYVIRDAALQPQAEGEWG